MTKRANKQTNKQSGTPKKKRGRGIARENKRGQKERERERTKMKKKGIYKGKANRRNTYIDLHIRSANRTRRSNWRKRKAYMYERKKKEVEDTEATKRNKQHERGRVGERTCPIEAALWMLATF